MVIPVGSTGGVQEMTLIVKKSDTENEISYHGSFMFVPFLKGKA